MPILLYILIVVVVGLLLYAIYRWVPMPTWVKTFLNVTTCILLVILFLHTIGLWGPILRVLGTPVSGVN